MSDQDYYFANSGGAIAEQERREREDEEARDARDREDDKVTIGLATNDTLCAGYFVSLAMTGPDTVAKARAVKVQAYWNGQWKARGLA